MNQEYIAHLRQKLKSKVDRLIVQPSFIFYNAHKSFWVDVKKDPFVQSLFSNLDKKHPDINSNVKRIFTEKLNFESFDLHELSEFDRERYLAYLYFITQQCINLNNLHFNDNDAKSLSFEIHAGRKFNAQPRYREDEALNHFKQEIIKPLSEYIDEQLDERKLIVEFIRRYKQKCEWFKRQYLYETWKNNTNKGEKLLALDLYEYLFDCGLEFSIESWSIDGEPDLVSAQKDDPLIADTKIFKGDKNYIIKGFNQVYTYTLTYNQPFGYLIIYNTCEKDLRFNLENQTQFTQFVTVNNKTIFITVIDIYQHDKTASQRKVIKPTEISEQELIASL